VDGLAFFLFQTASCSGLPIPANLAHSFAMGNKSRETIYGSSIRASAERAIEARKEADRLACEAWNQRMLGYKGPAQPSPALATRSMRAIDISRFVALAVTHIRPWRWISCAGRRRPRSTS
jgi:hypothetical protein